MTQALTGVVPPQGTGSAASETTPAGAVDSAAAFIAQVRPAADNDNAHNDNHATLAQPTLAPPHEASGMRNPPHTSIESTMAPTSEFVRYLLLALPSRYILRGLIGIGTDNKIGHPDNPSFINRPFVAIRRTVDRSFIDRFITNRIETEINGHLKEHPLHLAVPQGRDNPTKSATTTALFTEEGQKLRSKINRTLGRWDASVLTHDTAQWAYNNDNPAKLTTESKNKIRGHIKQGLNGMLYGHALGLGSVALTSSYSTMVFKDIKSIFSEAVAYETDKDAGKISFRDIRNSDNRIVQSTVSNWYGKTLGRLATDALFFVGAFGKSERFADVALGIKGAQSLFETWKREPTMFEQLTTLIHNKVNPKNGLGQPITAGDVFDLYQHYHMTFSPGKAFTNVVDNDSTESRAWLKGKVVFDRITELLNDTYAYKHATAIDPQTDQPIVRANFALPKLIYLLGHDLIDPAKPAETLLTIEVANRIGMKAVRELQAALKKGTPVAELSAHYLNIAPDILLKETRAHTPAAPQASIAPATHPDTTIGAERAPLGTLVTPAHSIAH